MSARRILVLGATGGTGRCVVEQAVGSGHDVTVLVRDPERLPPTARPVRVVKGDVLLDPTALDDAVADQDVVISVLGVGQSFTSHDLIARSAPKIVEAMHRHGRRRLVFTSAFGVRETRRDTPLLPRLCIATVLRDVYADKEKGEQAIIDSDLDWTVVHPVGLTDGERAGRYRVGERLSLSGFPRIARADVADFLLQQVDDGTYIRKGVLISP